MFFAIYYGFSKCYKLHIDMLLNYLCIYYGCFI